MRVICGFLSLSVSVVHPGSGIFAIKSGKLFLKNIFKKTQPPHFVCDKRVCTRTVLRSTQSTVVVVCRVTFALKKGTFFGSVS